MYTACEKKTITQLHSERTELLYTGVLTVQIKLTRFIN